MYIDITVEFTPQENGYQCDCIRIHSKVSIFMLILFLGLEGIGQLPNQLTNDIRGTPSWEVNVLKKP